MQNEGENKDQAALVEETNGQSKGQETVADGPKEPQTEDNGENAHQQASTEERKKGEDGDEQIAESKKKNKKGAKAKNDKGERKNKKEEVKEEKLTLKDFGITDDESYKPSLIQKVKELLQSKDKAEQKKAVQAILEWKLQSDIDLIETCQSLALNNQVDLVSLLIGKDEAHETTEKNLIEELLKKDEMKACDSLCTKFGFSIDDYPQLVNHKKSGSVRFYLNQYLKKKPTDWQFRGLNRVEELFRGLPEYLVKLCEMLVNEKRMDEAKGVYVRNNLTVGDFDKALPSSATNLQTIKEIGEEIEKHEYDETKDFHPKEDMFEPISEPHQDYIALPVDVKYEFIDTEDKINQLKVLRGQKFIGVDSEWRPVATRWLEANGPAVLQIAGYKEAFIIDLLALKNSKKLDHMLAAIFQNPKSTILGAGFSSDISQFHKHCENMKFLDYVPSFLEIQDFYKKVYPDLTDKGSSGIKSICENILGKKLCKNEQVSNWENRPLRYSQEHYGALDAFILVVVAKHMEQAALKRKVKVADLTKTIGQETNKMKVDNQLLQASKKSKDEETEPAAEEKEDKLSKYMKQLEYHKNKVVELEKLIEEEKLKSEKK